MEIEIKPARLYKEKLVLLASYLDSSHEEVELHLHEAIADYLANSKRNKIPQAVYDDLNRIRVMLAHRLDK